MINGKKVGVGVVTFNRPKLLKKCLDSLWDISALDTVVVVNDGKEMDRLRDDTVRSKDEWIWIETDGAIGVGKSKNLAFEELKDCDYIFLIEDDIYIKDPTVFEKYIDASNKTGLQHFNFSQHGIMNKSWPGGTPNPKTIIKYESVGINTPLYPHCVGAFSFYTKECLDKVGFMDERYYNACEHVDHTLSIINAGMHPPFWNFADIENSWDYLGDEEWSKEKSTISSNPKHSETVSGADAIFFAKYGHYPAQTEIKSESDIVKSLKQIKNNYALP